MRPTWSTKIVAAPIATARSTGMLLTSPPSKKFSPSSSTGGKSPGTAEEARTASAMEPSVNQCSAERSMLAATHWKGTASSSMRRTGRARSSACRRGSFGCAWVRVRARVPSRDSIPPLKMPASSAEVHSSVSLSTEAVVGSEARTAPVDGADRRAEDHVGDDARLEQGPEHSDLVGAEHATTTENEGDISGWRDGRTAYQLLVQGSCPEPLAGRLVLDCVQARPVFWGRKSP